jgi:uncharacterized LabA/DUF88 family protein
MSNPHVEKLRASVKGRIAVAIDAANLHKSVAGMVTGDAGTRYAVDYRKFKVFFAALGDLKRIGLYTAAFGDEGHHKFLYFLKKGLGFHLNTKPIKEYLDHTPEHPHRKANFDVEIAVDGTFTMGDFDTFVLFSGDCDFEYLVRFLRGHGKTVVVISHHNHIAAELIPAASRYFDIQHFKNELLRVEPKPLQDAKSPAR